MATNTGAPVQGLSERTVFATHRRTRLIRTLREQSVQAILFLSALVSIVITVSIVASLLFQSINFFLRPEVSLIEYLTGTRWAPQYANQSFGVLPLINGTLMITIGSALVAIPVGLGTAIYLSEYASNRARRMLKPMLEILAGIPTVVYGYFAITFITPILQRIFPSTSIFNAFSASIVVGVMIIPMVSSLSEDAMRAVPRELREGAYGLGATKFEVATRVITPAALSGILASFVLAISRAIGETMAVALAAGQLAQMTINPLDSVMTMTAYIVNVSLGDTPFGSVEYQSIFAVGLTLFVMTMLLNVASNLVLRRFREVYQ